MPEALPPVALALSFIDRINRHDLAGLSALMSTGHLLEVFDEEPVAGRDANADAWRGYLESFPRYVIHRRHIAERGASVAILGHTTGSHLGLSDDEESRLTLIWLAETANGAVIRWKLLEDTEANRQAVGLA